MASYSHPEMRTSFKWRTLFNGNPWDLGRYDEQKGGNGEM